MAQDFIIPIDLVPGEYFPPDNANPNPTPSLSLIPPMALQTSETNPHTAYSIAVKYLWFSESLQLPIAGPTPLAGMITSVIASMGLPIALKVVEWDCDRLGAQCILPSPVVTDTNLTLLQASITLPDPKITADGTTLRWQASGIYIFAMSVPWIQFNPAQVLPIQGPVNAAQTTTLTQTLIQPTQFQTGLF